MAIPNLDEKKSPSSAFPHHLKQNTAPKIHVQLRYTRSNPSKIEAQINTTLDYGLVLSGMGENHIFFTEKDRRKISVTCSLESSDHLHLKLLIKIAEHCDNLT